MVASGKAAADFIGAAHKPLALLLLVLIALHVSGALYHVLDKRDGVIRRMLPG